MLNEDIVGALAAGQTIGGWGGAFYYWNAPFSPPGGGGTTTVGTYIRSHPEEYEKFLMCNAEAALDTIMLTELMPQAERPLAYDGYDTGAQQRLLLLAQALSTGVRSQAPTSVKSDIMDRVTSILLTGKPAGDPDRISDYVYGSDYGSPGWTSIDSSMAFEFGPVVITPVRNQAVLAQLNARRAVRLAHQGFQYNR